MANYQIPAFGGPGKDLQGWLLEAVAEGDIWLRAQRPTSEWRGVMDMLGPLYGGGPGNNLIGQSNTGYNRARHLYSEVRATISNFKNAGEFSPTEDDAQEFFDRAHLLTNLDRDWERRQFSNLKFRDSLGYALAKGTGYLYEDWDPSALGPGRGDIRLRAWDPSDVTFVQMPKSHDIQQAYVVLIKETLPLMLAKRQYAWNPTFAAGLVPDGDETSWIQKGLETVQRAISPFLRTAGTSGQGGREHDGSPTVDIWHAYTLDGSVNPNHEPVKMGAMGTNWQYTVPALGDPIPQGIVNPATGQQWTLSAGPDDCLMFPLRRLTIFSRTGIAYDGSSPWWHGACPLARIRFNDLPWEALGASQVGDAKTIQDGIVQLMRIIEDSAAARMRPPKLFNDQIVDRAWADAFDTGKAGATAGADLSQGSPITFPFDPHFYDVPPWIGGEGGFIRQQEARMDYITSAQDLVAIAKARQIPGSDTLEKLMEMAGPIVQDMVGAIIEPATQLGEWRKAYYFQFYTKARMYRIADPDGVELMQALKYTPEKLMPYAPNATADQRAEQGRAYLEDFKYEVTRSGISEINRMSQLLMYIQLTKSGVLPLSKYTMAKAANVPNWGPPPLGTNTEQERVQADWRIDLERKIEEAQMVQAAMGQVAPGAGAPPPAPTPVGSEEGPGRPPSFAASPRIVSKDGGTRSTISTSR